MFLCRVITILPSCLKQLVICLIKNYWFAELPRVSSSGRYALLYRKACRHTLQIAVALGQIYGCLVYFGTPILEGKTYSLPTFVYFWLYYVVLNNIWVVVPGLIAGRAWILINKAVDERTPSSRNKKPLKQK